VIVSLFQTTIITRHQHRIYKDSASKGPVW
jgi:hypothetical protein